MSIQDPELREEFKKQQKKDHIGSIDPFFYNALRSAYSEEGYNWIRQVCQLVEENFKLIQSFCQREMPLIKPISMEGGFILWMDMTGLGLDDHKLQQFMEEEALVYGDPGIEYGILGSGFYRFQLATSLEKIRFMLSQLKKAYQKRGDSYDH